MKKKNIILANALINNGNRGCVALSYCSIYLIDKILGEGNYTLYLTHSGESYGKKTIRILDRELVYESVPIPYFYNYKESIQNIFKYKILLRLVPILYKSDYILDIGLGDSFADIYGSGRFGSMDYIHKIARFFHKPYILLPQTIGPFTEKSIRAKAKQTIDNALFVMVRDKQSYDFTKEISKTNNIREYIDVAFFLPYKKETFDKKYIHIGLNISALIWNGGYTKDNQFSLKCDYQQTIRKIIEYFLSLDDVIIHLVPHVVDRERNIENDYAVSFDLCEEYKNSRLIISPFFLSPIDAKSYIAGLDFFIGARMHATIAAFSSGVPVVPMAYSRKFNGLFIETLRYSYVADMKLLCIEEILNLIRKSYEKRYELFNIIMDSQEKIVENRKRQLLDDLKEVLM